MLLISWGASGSARFYEFARKARLAFYGLTQSLTRAAKLAAFGSTVEHACHGRFTKEFRISIRMKPSAIKS